MVPVISNLQNIAEELGTLTHYHVFDLDKGELTDCAYDDDPTNNDEFKSLAKLLNIEFTEEIEFSEFVNSFDKFINENKLNVPSLTLVRTGYSCDKIELTIFKVTSYAQIIRNLKRFYIPELDRDDWIKNVTVDDGKLTIHMTH